MKRYNFVITVTIICFCFLFLSISVIEAEQTTLKSSMPTPRMDSASATVGENIYIIGGVTKEDKVTAIVEQYNSSTDKWTKKGSMPTPRGGAAGVAVGKMIYVIGGYSGASGCINTVEVYDSVLNSWKKVKSISQPRLNYMVAEVGGKIYVIGGIIGVGDKREEVTDKVEIYDPQKDLWSRGHPMPAPKNGAAVAVVQGKIYIIGGMTGVGTGVGHATDNVEVYDPLKNSWSSARQKMQGARTGAKAAVVDEKIYVIGGTVRSVIIKPIEVYDPATDKCTTSKFSLQKPRTYHSVVSVGSKIYIIGGMIKLSLAGIVGTVEEVIVATEKRSNATSKDTATQAKTVKIVFVDESKPIQNKEIWLSFYDENTTTWITQKEKTNKDGMAIFKVPFGKLGESFTFIFDLSELNINKKIDEIKKKQQIGMRIPPGLNQESVVLQIDNKLNVKNLEGAIQLWSPYK